MSKTSFEVFVIVRHTRSGDKRIDIDDNKDSAMERAEAIAQQAANDYGYGSTYVYPATLTYTGKAIKGD